MSGLAGILRFDGAAATAAQVGAMTATLAHRGLGGAPPVLDGALGLAHAVASPDGRLLVSFAGRIDNRGELGAAASDAAAVLEAYERWGTAAFARILGDFALSLWDARRGELVCARDILGKVPFYFHVGAHALRFASEPQAVLVDAAIARRPNLAMIGEHLAGSVHSTRETLIAGLERLPPAHLLVVARDGTRRLERFWSWDRSRSLDLGDADAVAAFGEVFDAAVRARLDATATTGAELSGGLDSSAVVAVAARHAPLDAYSLVFPGDPSDETPYIRAVAEHAGVTPFEAEPQPAGAALYEEQVRRHLDLPEPPNLAMHRVLYAEAQRRGTRVMLTGTGGDEWLTGSPLAYAERLRGLRPRGLRAAAAAQREVWPARSRLHQLVRDGLMPLLRPALQARLQHALGREGIPEWMPADLWRREGLDERLRPQYPRGPRLAAADLARTLDDGATVHVAEASERTLAAFGLEGRSPFDDRRVIELALALPERLRQRDGVVKWLVREATAGLLPELVRKRTIQVGFRVVFLRELAAQGGGALFDDLAIAELGWVDGARLRRAYDELLALHARGEGHPLLWPMWNALAVERWVREVL